MMLSPSSASIFHEKLESPGLIRDMFPLLFLIKTNFTTINSLVQKKNSCLSSKIFAYLITFTEIITCVLPQIEDKIIVYPSESQGLLRTLKQ